MLWLSQAHAGTFMPVEGSTFAGQVDSLYKFLLISSLIACVLVIGGLILFAIRYRRRSDDDKTAYISHNGALEFAWSFIPFVIFIVTFGWGWYVYHHMRSMPKEALEVHVVGQKWSWDFLYKSGRRVSKEFYVPVNKPVKLIMSSKDVIHSFYIPGFRIKQDVVPGRYSSLWFEATKEGTFNVFCTEYCGTGHSAMLAKLHVLPLEEFENWLKNDPYKGLSLVEVGEKVFAGKCVACHNNTTEKKVGPGFAKLFGKSQTFEKASSLTVDENYIRESVLNPNAKVVKGFPKGVMPSFQGQLAEQEILGLIEYIKSLN